MRALLFIPSVQTFLWDLRLFLAFLVTSTTEWVLLWFFLGISSEIYSDIGPNFQISLRASFSDYFPRSNTNFSREFLQEFCLVYHKNSDRISPRRTTEINFLKDASEIIWHPPKIRWKSFRKS